MSALQADVLVLNKNWLAVSIVEAAEALADLFMGKVVAVDEDYNQHDFSSWQELSEYKSKFHAEEYGWVQTVKDRILVPSVVRLLDFDKPQKSRLRLSRRNIYKRDGHTCFPPYARVRMADGTWRPIHTLQVGDRVLSGTGKPVDVLFLHRQSATDGLVRVNRCGCLSSLLCTPDHRIYAAKYDKTSNSFYDRGFVAADSLTSDDWVAEVIARLAGGEFNDNLPNNLGFRKRDGHLLFCRVKSVDRVTYEGDVYDLEVGGDHTFVVDHLLVHNCQYTGKRLPASKLNLDHVLPKSRGGRTTWENIVCCSVEVNTQKRDRTPEEAGLKLIRPPREPLPGELTMSVRNPPKTWQAFVSDAYWNTELED